MSMYRIYLVKSDSEEFTFPQTNKEHGEEVREIMEFEATEAEAKDAFFAAATNLDDRKGSDDDGSTVRNEEGTQAASR